MNHCASRFRVVRTHYLRNSVPLLGALAFAYGCGPSVVLDPDGGGGAGGGQAAGGSGGSAFPDGGRASGGSVPGGGAPTTGGSATGGGSPSGGANSGSCEGDAADAYQGAPAALPGVVEAEAFDTDGFQDGTPGNEGATFRTDVDVDIKALGGGYAVGWMTSGEWLEYTVNVATAGAYDITVKAGAVDADRTLSLTACGRALGEVTVPTVADWGETGEAHLTANLEAGLQVLRVEVGANDYIDFDSLTFAPAGQGSGGAPGAGGSSGGTGGGPGAGGAGAGGSPGSGGGGSLPRFVGNITTGNSIDSGNLIYSDYWDQITPENAGKWGSVQSSGGAALRWDTLDGIYDYTQRKGIIFKQHAFIWGTQQPSGSLSEANVRDWISAFCQRYPATRLIDVVNEPPPHTTPSYVDAIGGGTNGNWAWITNAFKWARASCPNAILILNDYNNIEWPNDNQHFIDIVKTVMQNGGPIDAVGAQAHDFDHASMSVQTVERLLDKLHNDTGLPVYITELDLSYTDDQQQLNAYQQYFPMVWGKDYVPGVTIWGWIYGRTWSQAPNSGLVRDGRSRSAMTWLMNELDRPAP